jgi:hypothetical protein
VIVDEGQDFREEWWLLVQAALKDPGSGTLYIFHDDTQALLPHRASYPFNEPIVDLSRNCRNAGQIYELMGTLHPMAPLADRELDGQGHVFVEFCDDGQEGQAIRNAIARLSEIAPNDVVVLFAGDRAATESLFNDLSYPTGPDVHWQEEVRWMFMHAARTRNTVIAPLLHEIENPLRSLSNELRPTAADVKLVQDTAKMFKVQAKVRQQILRERAEGLVWQYRDGKAKLRSQHRDIRDVFASEIIMHFEKDSWNLGMPDLDTVPFTGGEAPAGLAIPIRHISEFKGLESNSVLLYIQRLDSMADEELLVGISRARLLLAMVIQSQTEKSIPQALRNKLLRRSERNQSRFASQHG